MKKLEDNYAFIDSQNVQKSLESQGWKISWKKFRVYLKEKYSVTKAYLFIGYLPENQSLYTMLQSFGFVLIFKPVLHLGDGKTKGNVDAELVLQTMIDYYVYEKAIIITGDGDFSCLVHYLYKNNKLKRLIVPDKNHYSVFLKKEAKELIDNLTDLKQKLEYKKGAHT